MLTLDKFNTGRNLHSTFNPLVTAIFTGIAYLILTQGRSWSRINSSWELPVSVLLLAVLAFSLAAMLCGVLALKNRFTQMVYSIAAGGSLVLFIESIFRIMREGWLLILAGVCSSILIFFILRKLFNKPSIVAALQCFLGTLAGIVFISEFIYFARSLF